MASDERQAGDEITVTPEMIGAGLDTLGSNFLAVARGNDDDQRRVVAAIYVKMEEARRVGAREILQSR